MNRIQLIIRRDFREMRRSAAFKIMLGITLAITIAAAIGISIALHLQPWLGEAAARPVLELIIGLVLYFLPVAVLLAYTWTFVNLPVTKEKVNGNIDALMATPLLPRDLWLGKSFAVFIPAYITCAIATVVVVLVIDLAVILPATGGFVLPIPAAVLGIVVNPLFFFILILFMILFSLMNDPEIALAPSLIIGFGIMMGIPAGLATGVIDFTSWTFVFWYLGATIVAWAIVGYLSRLLSKEKIVLSSKGT